jgi:hypothetical protein
MLAPLTPDTFAAMGEDRGAALDAATLDADEQALVERIEERRDDLVALACELIGFDTTSRSSIEDPPREEAALQQALADRLAAAGAEIDLWEPAPEDVAGHPLSVEGIGFTGRPQLAARLRGSGGGRSLLLNGHIDVVPAHRDDGWDHDPFDPQVLDGRIVGRGACDMKGGIAAMVLAAEVLAEHGGLAGDVIVCTNTDEESSGVGGLACASTAPSACPAGPATPSRSIRTGATAARSTRSTRAASSSTASTGCGGNGARGPTSGTRCWTRRTSSPPASSPTPGGTSRSRTMRRSTSRC